ncbi:DUF1320 domain-containing protein [Kiloniella majae]|uniref:DUF1320 domain-containing protein n=1 Tax=Kiloniella majae TaxID=1938558 RepID=UPI000A277B69|nr:DUF1320 domain-containing protein [Kiloniella majae]
MMAYADSAEMVKRFKDLELVDLTNQDDPLATTINDDELLVALDDATAEIDAILSPRLVLPLNPVPAVMVSLCCDIARFRLYANGAPTEVQNRYDTAKGVLATLPGTPVS